MLSRKKAPRPRARVAAIGVPVALMAAGTTTVLTAAPAAGETGRDTEQCQVVQLAEPSWGHDGGVMDIEKVGGRVVYYGNIQHRVRGEDHQRALIWRGRNAQPERVGPSGFDDDLAYELTDTGLINGTSENWETGETRHWVQDLATMEISFLDVDSGPRGTDHGGAIIRRINGSGAAAGTVSRSADPEVFGSDAVAFDHPAAGMTILDGSAGAYEGAALGINDAGERVGLLGTDLLPDNPEFLIFDAMKWNADGSRTELASRRTGSTRSHGTSRTTAPRRDSSAGATIRRRRTSRRPTGRGPAETSASASCRAAPSRTRSGWTRGAGWSVDGSPRRRRGGPVAGPEGCIDHSFLWRARLGEGQRADPALALRPAARPALGDVGRLGGARGERGLEPGRLREPRPVRRQSPRHTRRRST